MLPFKFGFKLNAQEYAATATPFEKVGGISYDISIPDKIFTIKAMPLKDGGVVWVDYYSAEPTELSLKAGNHHPSDKLSGLYIKHKTGTLICFIVIHNSVTYLFVFEQVLNRVYGKKRHSGKANAAFRKKTRSRQANGIILSQ